MRFHQASLAAIAAIATLFVTTPAAAAASSFASLSVTYTLVDLSPMDGITASIQFGTASDYANYAYVYVDSPPEYRLVQGAGNVSASFDVPKIQTTSSVVNNGSDEFNLSASGSAANPTSDSEGTLLGSDHNSFDSIAAASREFTLSANTMVIFSGVSRIGVTVVDVYSEDAFSYATLSAEGYSQDGAQSQYSFDANYLAEKVYAAPSQLQDLTLRVSFSNLTAVVASGSMSAQIEAHGFTNAVTPVPEPETYAMLLAGLGLIGAAARRRQKI